MCKGSNLLLKGFLFISLISSCYVHAYCMSEGIGKNLHKAFMHNFVVKIEKIYPYILALLDRKNFPYSKEKMSGTYRAQWTKGTLKPSSFIKNLKGKIANDSSSRKTIVRRTILPNKKATVYTAQKNHFVLNNTNWNGNMLPEVKINNLALLHEI